MFSDRIIATLRTLVPVVVGSALTSLGVRLHIVLSPHTRDALVVFVTAVVIAVYYALVRLLERWVPALGWLLGYPAKPSYAEVLADGTAVVTSLVPRGPDPLGRDGSDPNTPGAAAARTGSV